MDFEGVGTSPEAPYTLSPPLSPFPRLYGDTFWVFWVRDSCLKDISPLTVIGWLVGL